MGRHRLLRLNHAAAIILLENGPLDCALNGEAISGSLVKVHLSSFDLTWSCRGIQLQAFVHPLGFIHLPLLLACA
jgi:hypothetical protein